MYGLDIDPTKYIGLQLVALYLTFISTLLEIIVCKSVDHTRPLVSFFMQNRCVTQPISYNTGRVEVEEGVSPGSCKHHGKNQTRPEHSAALYKGEL